MLLAFFGGRTRQFNQFGHFEANFFLDNLTQSDIRSSEVSHISHQRPAYGPGPRIKLTDSA